MSSGEHMPHHLHETNCRASRLPRAQHHHAPATRRVHSGPVVHPGGEITMRHSNVCLHEAGLSCVQLYPFKLKGANTCVQSHDPVRIDETAEPESGSADKGGWGGACVADKGGWGGACVAVLDIPAWYLHQ